MADFRIVCVTQSRNSGHDGHITNVGTGPTATNYTRTWTVTEARQAIDRGETFHTLGPSSGKRAAVRKWDCSCGYKTLKSAADAVTDNNLDNISPCR